MGSEDSGRQPPFSPIGYRHESVVQEDCSSRNGTERATQVSDPFVPPIQVIQLWKDVANVYETQKQVIWKAAVESLNEAYRFIRSDGARHFIENYMKHIIGILLDQVPSKLGLVERNCVEESLKTAQLIVIEDLTYKVYPKAGECVILEVLSSMFNRKRSYYKTTKANWAVDYAGLPEVRNQLIAKFKSVQGFKVLGEYFNARLGSTEFPSFDIIHILLNAAAESMNQTTNGIDAETQHSLDDGLILFGRSIMDYIYDCSEETLKKQSYDNLSMIIEEIQRLYERFAYTRKDEFHAFFDYNRKLALKLITSQSLPLRLYGWEIVKNLVDVGAEYRPPPRAFRVYGAGNDIVNGMYVYASQTAENCYAKPGSDLKYELRLSDIVNRADGTVKQKTLTLFRCTMRSTQKWWFLSEADEAQPGTDKDVDYYQHKSKKHEESLPSLSGWNTCKNAGNQGIDPPPNLESVDFVTPPGEEFNTLEHQLARWAIENNVVEILLGDSIHREIVARSIPFIRFLVYMCSRDDTLGEAFASDPRRNAYCLRASHLKLAWRICTNKLDAAVSTEVLHLLVCILPSLPEDLSILLLNDAHQSLNSYSMKNENVMIVAEFCSSLASLCNSDHEKLNNQTGSPLPNFSDNVRLEVLKLMWNILNHPDASALKCYDVIKDFVSTELRIEPLGTIERLSLLKQCKESLLNCSEGNVDVMDELSLIRRVNLTLFVLEACPLEQSIDILSADGAALPVIIFDELVAYLQRLTKFKSNVIPAESTHDIILPDRLYILRYVYGVSESLNLSICQLDTLWDLCIKTCNTEAFLVFLAYSSVDLTSPMDIGEKSLDVLLSRLPQWNGTNSVTSRVQLTAAFSKEVKEYVLEVFFCSARVDWRCLGLKAYQSFSFFHALSLHTADENPIPSLDGPAIDTLWRICLESAGDDVASQAMTDLLHLYLNSNRNSVDIGNKSIEERLYSFADRIYEALRVVYHHILTGNHNALRSAERCCKIMLTAVAHDTKDERGAARAPDFASIVLASGMNDYLKWVPHGLRGQSCYRTISVHARRTQNNTSSHPESSSASGVTLPPSQRFFMQIHPLEPLGSMKKKIAHHCEHDIFLVRPISHNGRRALTSDQSQNNLNVESDDATVSSMGIISGSEIVVLLAHPPVSDINSLDEHKRNGRKDLLGVTQFIFGGCSADPNRFYDLLLRTADAVLKMQGPSFKENISVSQLFWDLLSAIPSNAHIVDRVKKASEIPTNALSTEHMILDTIRKDDEWNSLFDEGNIQKSFYVLQIIDSFLNPATEIIENAPNDRRDILLHSALEECSLFRKGFIETGGFDILLKFFAHVCTDNDGLLYCLRVGHSFILRILKSCFTGTTVADIFEKDKSTGFLKPDDVGRDLMKSLSDPVCLLEKIVLSTIRDSTVSEYSVADALLLTRIILMENNEAVLKFSELENGLAEKFTMLSLLWKSNGSSISSLCSEMRIRKNAAGFILETPSLLPLALNWMIQALEIVEMSSESCSELFSVLIQVVETRNEIMQASGIVERLCYVVCVKLAMYPRRSVDDFSLEYSTEVLCGCLRLLQALVNFATEDALGKGVAYLLDAMRPPNYEEDGEKSVKPLINLIRVIFERFFEGEESTGLAPLCSDNTSRHLAFSIILAAAAACLNGDGFIYLSQRVNQLVDTASPSLFHHWGVSLGSVGSLQSQTSIRSKYSGLRNQGCTCYMNSVLQQLFMMPHLQRKICSAALPLSLRSSNVQVVSHGQDFIGKRIVLPWENGRSYEAIVEGYDEKSGFHKIRYFLMNSSPESRFHAPEALPEEFNLLEGRPGKEVGSYCFSQNDVPGYHGTKLDRELGMSRFDETPDEVASRRLLEEVQRTFVHLEAGSRGRCFDPRAFVESCTCLKLEFDVWQQNDASEFAMKLLDRLEPALKRWSPDVFKYVENTFRLKQTKQKICKECGVKTNREESFMSIDCQIRGKADIHEALASMCDIEYMEGDNKVYCDQCKKKCDTILRTAISVLPDVLILSLKRFDLDYNTFETVKLNSRCAFGHRLNVKKYTLDGVEVATPIINDNKPSDAIMDTGDSSSPGLSDDYYDYNLVGVLVHAGVAQGGHYYSLIKDRSTGSSDESARWYKFDDEDVTIFDQSAIETECFGGKIKKETKWPNGTVQVVESEQFANALMLFYEKVKPARVNTPEEIDCCMDSDADCNQRNYLVSGYDAFLRDVRRSNATYSQHSFMFDLEFQNFFKRCLDVLYRSLDQPLSHNVHVAEKTVTSSSWQIQLLNTCIAYFFDILLHSKESTTLDDWTNKLDTVLRFFKAGSSSFVSDLSTRTIHVRRNWIRIFLADCPDENSRSSAVRIFTTALQSCLSLPLEVTLLRQWNDCLHESLRPWKLENSDRKSSLKPPPTLNDLLPRIKYQSPIGIIILYAAQLLDIAPQIWRNAFDLFEFVRDVASLDQDDQEFCTLSAVIESLIPARLLCLTLKDQAPQYMKAVFPQASMSHDMARKLVKCEAKGNSVSIQPAADAINPLDTNSNAEIGALIEAIAAVLNLKAVRLTPHVHECGYKGKRVMSLTNTCINALATVHREWSTDEGLMGTRELMDYLQHCGFEYQTQTQHVLNILHKYGTSFGTVNCMTVEGFTAFYRDIAQNDPDRVLHDLCVCGYRPNLTRRQESVLVYSFQGHKCYYDYAESVALDIAMNLTQVSAPRLDDLTSSAFVNLNLFTSAFYYSHHLAIYLIARSCYEKDTMNLISEILRIYYKTISSWNSNTDYASICVKILGVIAAIPDKFQRERVTAILTCSEKINAGTDTACGILHMLKALYSMRQNPNHYAIDFRNVNMILERYMELLRELQRQREVCTLLGEIRGKWQWVDQLLSSHPSRPIPSAEGTRRRDERAVMMRQPAYIETTFRQYDGNSPANSDSADSENAQHYSDEDDDSRYDVAESSSLNIEVITVSGAGVEYINGTYNLNGEHDRVKKYKKISRHQDREQIFVLFRCKLNDGSRRWYISIIPDHAQPGTRKDIDFYYNPATGLDYEMPPTDNWVICSENGVAPPPKLYYTVDDTVDEDEILEQVDPTRQGGRQRQNF